MLYELRVYQIAPGRVKAVIDRFANVCIGLFHKHGVKPILFLEPVIGSSFQIIYLLEWKSLAEREERWDAFQNDPEWIAARTESEKGGPILTGFTNTILREVPSIMAVIRDLQG